MVISSGGYKGYGLAMMVDVFCGLLSGSAFGPSIKKWQGDDFRVADLVIYQYYNFFKRKKKNNNNKETKQN